MGPIATGFGLAAVAVVALSLCRGWRHPSFRVALMLLVFWAIANLTDPWVDPIMDLAGFYAMFQVWFMRANQRWAIVVWFAFAFQLLSHPVFMFDTSAAVRFWILNLLYAVELMATAFPSAKMLAKRLGRALSKQDWAVAGDRLCRRFCRLCRPHASRPVERMGRAPRAPSQ